LRFIWRKTLHYVALVARLLGGDASARAISLDFKEPGGIGGSLFLSVDPLVNLRLLLWGELWSSS